LASKTALITGANGQDGSFLSELLVAEGYDVHGTIRRSSTDTLWRLAGIRDRITLHYCDVTDPVALVDLVRQVEPNEVYHLAAMSDVRVSFDTPHYAAQATAVGALNVLEAVRLARPQAKIYMAGSSEQFGTNPRVPCNEQDRFEPASPYAASKVFAYHLASQYRQAYDMFVVNGILFNHESERRGNEFVTRKITKGVRAVIDGRARTVKLGNMTARRDWGYAPDYMYAAWLMMQYSSPEDFVVATGENHTVAEFAQEAFAHADLDWQDHVEYDPHLERPIEVPNLLGDYSKAYSLLGWEPQVRFQELVRRMVSADLCT
jgi:GDPmannose 4,6-dehydratase